MNHKIDINNLSKLTVNSIPLNGIGLIELLFNKPIVLDKHNDCKITGNMIFIDKINNNTVRAGMIYKPFLHNDKIEQTNDYSSKFKRKLDIL